MENPFAPPLKKRGQNPPPFNSFQRELEHKMKARKHQGLAADVTPSESGQDSDEELDSDNELLQGFNFSGKGKTSNRKSPLSELNGTRNGKKASKEDVIFGKKNYSLYDDEDSDDGYGENNLLKTSKKPMNLNELLKGGSKTEKSNRKKDPYSKSSIFEEDETDAAPFKNSKYSKSKTWQPPNLKKMEEDDEQLKLDLNKTKLRSKSPKPGRKTPSDLGSITEEHERELDLDEEEEYLSKSTNKKKESKPTPKPRGAGTDPKPKPRVKSPALDLFGSGHKNRSKSPVDKDEVDEVKSSKGRKTPEPKKQSVLDFIKGSASDQKSNDGKKGQRPSDKNQTKPKTKYLTKDEDSDDSIGGEFGRNDAVTRSTKNKYGSPLDLHNPDRNRKSPFDKDRMSPFDREERSSPFDPRNRKSPFDLSQRKSPLDDRRASPFSVDEDKKNRDFNSHANRSFQDSLQDYRNEKGKDYRKQTGKDALDEREENKYNKRNPFDDRKSPFDSRGNERDDRKSPFDSRGKERDDRKSPFDSRGKERDDRKSPFHDSKHREFEDSKNPYKDRHKEYEDSRESPNPFDNRKVSNKLKGFDNRKSPLDDRYNRFDDNRKEYDRRSPFDDDRHDFKNRKSPFDKNRYDDSYDEHSYKKKVGFEPPSLKKERERHEREKYDKYQRDGPPRLRHDDDYDDYSRRHGDHKSRPRNAREEEEEWGRRQSRKEKRGGGDNRESSLCREVEADPSPMKKPDSQEITEIKKKEVRSHTKEKSILDQAIESVKDEQHKFRPVEPDNSEDGEEKKQKPRAMSARHKPKPRYAKPMVETFPTRPSSAIDPNNTSSIRDAVFMEWYKERQEKARKEKEEKLKKEREEQKKKEKEEKDKLLESQASYNAWMEKKEERLKEEARKKRREQYKKAKEQEEKEEKKKEAEMVFRKWKEEKDVIVSDKVRSEKRAELRKEQEKEEAKKLKEKDAKSAFNKWNSQKEDVLKESAYEKQKRLAREKREERKKQEERELEATKSYEKWMHKKEKDTREMRKSMKTRKLQEFEPKPAWSPASKTIPFGR